MLNKMTSYNTLPRSDVAKDPAKETKENKGKGSRNYPARCRVSA